MTIWILLDSSGMGGIESHVAELSAGLAGHGKEPIVVFLKDHAEKHPLKARLGTAGVPFRSLSGSLLDLAGELSRARPEILHTHGYKAGIMGRLAAAAAGIPCVSTFHAGERPRGVVALYDLADRWGSLGAVRIAVSPQIQARIPYPSTLVPNFVAVPVSAAHASPPLTVAFAGRMSREKGTDIFCELAAAAPGPAYIAYGDGPERSACEQKSGGVVTFMGAKPGMDGEWKNIGLLAITSRAEGLPLAALEAMSNGVPVAAFGLGGLPLAIRHGAEGFIAEPGNLGELAGYVREWFRMSPASRAAMGEAARNRIRRDYGCELGISRILEVYRTALRGPQPY